MAMMEYVYSPCLGQIKDITQCSDQAFAEKQMGDGVFILPESNLICAPCSGTIGNMFSSNHAFTVISEAGTEILVHIGVETVQLKGACFRRLAQPGQHVLQGTPIIQVDFRLIRRRKLDPSVLVVAIDDEVKITKSALGRSDSLNTELFSIQH